MRPGAKWCRCVNAGVSGNDTEYKVGWACSAELARGLVLRLHATQFVVARDRAESREGKKQKKGAEAEQEGPAIIHLRGRVHNSGDRGVIRVCSSRTRRSRPRAPSPAQSSPIQQSGKHCKEAGRAPTSDPRPSSVSGAGSKQRAPAIDGAIISCEPLTAPFREVYQRAAPACRDWPRENTKISGGASFACRKTGKRSVRRAPEPPITFLRPSTACELISRAGFLLRPLICRPRRFDSWHAPRLTVLAGCFPSAPVSWRLSSTLIVILVLFWLFPFHLPCSRQCCFVILCSFPCC